MNAATLRIDRLLWYLRLAPSRSLAQNWVVGGHIRANGQRVTKSAFGVRVGDVLTLPMPGRVRVIEIMALPPRRGPAGEAASCFRERGPKTSAEAGGEIESDSQHREMIDDSAPLDLGDGARDASSDRWGRMRKGA